MRDLGRGLRGILTNDKQIQVLDLDGNLSQYEGNISDLTMFGRPPELDAIVNKVSPFFF